VADYTERLQSARIARLATLDAEGESQLLPVCFVVDGERIYTAVDGKPKKVAPRQLARLRHILSHPQVALLVDHYEEDWSKLWYLLVRGHAALVPEHRAEERASALALLKAKYPQYCSGLLPDDAPLIRIDIERVTGWQSAAGS
jgi:PPOX class probable F420-dependent enzyme